MDRKLKKKIFESINNELPELLGYPSRFTLTYKAGAMEEIMIDIVIPAIYENYWEMGGKHVIAVKEKRIHITFTPTGEIL